MESAGAAGCVCVCVCVCVTLCIAITPTTTLFALGHIYTNMTFGLFTNIAPNGLTETCLHICPIIRSEVLTGPTSSGSPRAFIIPSGGTEIPTIRTQNNWLAVKT